MSYNNNNTNPHQNRWEPPTKPSTSIPQQQKKSSSLLGNLLTKQKASAHQTDRYRMQIARPFASPSQLDKKKSKSDKANAMFNSRQNDIVSRKSDSSSNNMFSNSNHRRSISNTQNNASSTTAVPRRKVTFGAASLLVDEPIRSQPKSSGSVSEVEQPKVGRKRSRWDVRPKVELPPPSTSTSTAAFYNNTTMQPNKNSSHAGLSNNRWDVKPQSSSSTTTTNSLSINSSNEEDNYKLSKEMKIKLSSQYVNGNNNISYIPSRDEQNDLFNRLQQQQQQQMEDRGSTIYSKMGESNSYYSPHHNNPMSNPQSSYSKMGDSSSYSPHHQQRQEQRVSAYSKMGGDSYSPSNSQYNNKSKSQSSPPRSRGNDMKSRFTPPPKRKSRENTNSAYPRGGSDRLPPGAVETSSSNESSAYGGGGGKECSPRRDYSYYGGNNSMHEGERRSSYYTASTQPTKKYESIQKNDIIRQKDTVPVVQSKRDEQEVVHNSPSRKEPTIKQKIDSSPIPQKINSPSSLMQSPDSLILKKKKKRTINDDESKFNDTTPKKKTKKSPTKSSPTKLISFDPPQPKKKRKKKEISPFRVKLGCIVAIRFRKLDNGGNNEIIPVIKDGESFIPSPEPETATNKDDNDSIKKRKAKLYEIWSDPIPGVDDGISTLLGSWISCVFSKSYVKEWQSNNTTESSVSSLGHGIEGTVISIVDTSEDDNDTDDTNSQGITVHLLVNKWSIKSLPYLQAVSSDNSNTADASVSAKEQQWREREAKIRGKDNVIVRVTLASIYNQRNNDDQLKSSGVATWAIRKRVSARPSGKKKDKKKKHNDSLYIGDGNDTKSQQVQNWRWLASHASSSSRVIGTDGSNSGLDNNIQDSTSQLIGEVVEITRTSTTSEEEEKSLATVTIKRLLSPEQTQGGRLPHHGALELFDTTTNTADNSSSNVSYFQAPIEDLIVVGKRINRLVDVWKQPNLNDQDSATTSGLTFTITHSYQASNNTYTPLSSSSEDGSNIPKESIKGCHNCQRYYHKSQLNGCDQHEHDDLGEAYWCSRCLELKGVSPPVDDSITWVAPCCLNKKSSSETPFIANTSLGSGISDSFSALRQPLQSITSPIDFTLPDMTEQLSLRPSFLPNSGNMKSKNYNEVKREKVVDEKKPVKKSKKQKMKDLDDTNEKPKKKAKVKQDKPKKKAKAKGNVVTTEEDTFKPECHREVPLDLLSKMQWGSSKTKLSSNDDNQPFFRENARPRAIKIGKIEEKTTLTGRAARASQRRMVKGLAAFGDAKVDRLAGRDREKLLRFDKSKIHGWGVFTEAPINAGDMIIEYRGQLIGNAMADKREMEYEKKNMDDYMFRIDGQTVCDATMLGNVARYINASCSPNCYTQIITAGENKRIVIYAKRDIKRGEELCYDYMFAFELDPEKRLECNCGAPGCKGFMNWDDKFVAVDQEDDKKTENIAY